MSGAAWALDGPKNKDFRKEHIGVKAFVLLSTSNWRVPTKGNFYFLYIHVYRVGPKDGTRQQGLAFPIDNPYVKSHYPGEYAITAWRTMQPGNYELMLVTHNSLFCMRDAPVYKFTLKPGDVVYLGDLHFRSGNYEIVDRYERDYSFFSAKAAGVKPERFERLSLQPSRTITTC
jgi:hypothetical protein